MKKYELLKEDTVTTPSGKTLYRIKALVAIGLLVSPGDLGGYIEDTKNLDMSGDAWVSGNAQVYGDAWVYGDAQVYGNAWVSGDARVFGNAWVCGDAQVYGDAWVCGDARVYGDAWVKEKNDIQWFSNVGSEYGTLTVCKAKKGLFVSRGCFAGTLDEFKAAVSEKHGTNKYGRHYQALIDAIEIWFS